MHFGAAGGFSASSKKLSVLSWEKRGVLTTSPAVGWCLGKTGLPLPGKVTSAPWWQWVASNDDSFMSISVTIRFSS